MSLSNTAVTVFACMVTAKCKHQTSWSVFIFYNYSWKPGAWPRYMLRIIDSAQDTVAGLDMSCQEKQHSMMSNWKPNKLTVMISLAKADQFITASRWCLNETPAETFHYGLGSTVMFSPTFNSRNTYMREDGYQSITFYKTHSTDDLINIAFCLNNQIH